MDNSTTGDDEAMNDPTLDAEIGGQKLKYSGPVNTLFTVLTFFVVGLLAYGLYTHDQNSKETALAFVGALKEQTAAMKDGTAVAREQNCLLKFSQEQRQVNAEFCKQITGSR